MSLWSKFINLFANRDNNEGLIRLRAENQRFLSENVTLSDTLTVANRDKENLYSELKILREKYEALSASSSTTWDDLLVVRKEMDKIKFDLTIVNADRDNIKRSLADLEGLHKNTELLLTEVRQKKDEYFNKTIELESVVDELKAQLPQPIPRPSILSEISQVEVNKLLRDVLPKTDLYARDPFNYSDDKYGLTTISDVVRFLQACQINKLTYITEVLDCDDFASGLHGHLSTEPGWSGIAEALVWGNFPGISPHVWNLIIAYPDEVEKTPTVYFVEPQSDQVWEVAKETFEGLKIWLVVM